MSIAAIFVGTAAELKALTSAQRAGAGGARVLRDPAGDESLPPAWYFFVSGSTEPEALPTTYRSDDDAGTWFIGSGSGEGVEKLLLTNDGRVIVDNAGLIILRD